MPKNIHDMKLRNTVHDEYLFGVIYNGGHGVRYLKRVITMELHVPIKLN